MTDSKHDDGANGSHTTRRPVIWIVVAGAAVVLMAVVVIAGHTAITDRLYQWTGESKLFPQVKALTDLAAGLARPAVDTADLVPIQHGGVNPYGVNVFLEQEVEPTKRELAVQMAAAAGFHWLRQEFPWEDIEISAKGDFWDHKFNQSAWAKYDHIVDLAEKYDRELIVRLSNPPAWSRAAGNDAGTYAPPDDFDDFGDFVEAVVTRYRGRVKYYQIWNEPNIYPEWGEQAVDPEAYAELLKVAATRARAADPEAVIILGALASTIELTPTPPYGLNDLVYLQRLYDAGAAPYFDILAMQGYGLWSGPTDQRMHPRVMNFSRPRFVRDLMVRNGDAHKPIWISEMNWNAVPDDIPDKRFGQVTPEGQASYLVQAYARLQEEWPWLGVANTWYLKRASDQWEQERKPEAYFRLLTPGFEPLPVYDAIKAYTAQPPQLGRGFHQEDHWALDYTGGWNTVADAAAVLGHYRVSTTSASALRFRVGATPRVTLVIPLGASTAVQGQVDGQNIDLQPTADPQRFVVATNLGPGVHDIELYGELAIDGILVE